MSANKVSPLALRSVTFLVYNQLRSHELTIETQTHPSQSQNLVGNSISITFIWPDYLCNQSVLKHLRRYRKTIHKHTQILLFFSFNHRVSDDQENAQSHYKHLVSLFSKTAPDGSSEEVLTYPSKVVFKRRMILKNTTYCWTNVLTSKARAHTHTNTHTHTQ